ncbi:MAG: AfsR family transcriptional regulator, partial [Nocardiopsaceae bacterium]|nr:AfsR family transcriptional regulator [Nocardiopsaceae bacterium]
AMVRPGFAATAPDAGAITRICRALDGLPLAIELAAVWLRTLNPAQLAERLGDRFELLTSGTRTALPRHQTLRAVVDWSWDLLSEPERILARRLAVFPVGATLAAAERVCADPDLPGQAVLPALNGLVAKSILTVLSADAVLNDTGEGDPRYRMLETVRAYCLRRLAEAGEDARVRGAFAAYYLHLAETADPLLRTREQARWFAEFAAEQDNLHAALRGAITSGDARTAYRLVRALGYYWVQHGLGDGHALAAEVLAMGSGDVDSGSTGSGSTGSGSTGRSREMAEARVICSFLAAGPGFDLGAVRPAIIAALAELEEVTGGDAEIHPVAALLSPMLALYDRDPERAISLFRRYTASTDPMLRGMGLFYTARLAGQLGRVEEAETDFRAALAEIRSVGDRYVIAIALMHLAQFAELRADHAAALGMLTEGRDAGAELGGHWVDLWYLDGMLALVRARAGDLAGARADLARASGAMSRGGGDAEDAAIWLRSVEAEVAWLAGDLPGARHCYADVLASLQGKPAAWWHPSQILASIGQARTELALGDADRCRSLLADALRLAADWYEHPPLAAVLDAIAARAARDGRAETAARLLGAAHSVRGAFDESSLDAPRARQAARETLGPAAFDTAYAAGRSLSRPEAAALADSALAETGRRA